MLFCVSVSANQPSLASYAFSDLLCPYNQRTGLTLEEDNLPSVTNLAGPRELERGRVRRPLFSGERDMLFLNLSGQMEEYGAFLPIVE